MFVIVNILLNKIIIKLAISPILRFILIILILFITRYFCFSILPVVHAEGWGGTNSIGNLYGAMDENRRLEIEHDKEELRLQRLQKLRELVLRKEQQARISLTEKTMQELLLKVKQAREIKAVAESGHDISDASKVPNPSNSNSPETLINTKDHDISETIKINNPADIVSANTPVDIAIPNVNSLVPATRDPILLLNKTDLPIDNDKVTTIAEPNFNFPIQELTHASNVLTSIHDIQEVNKLGHQLEYPQIKSNVNLPLENIREAVSTAEPESPFAPIQPDLPLENIKETITLCTNVHPQEPPIVLNQLESEAKVLQDVIAANMKYTSMQNLLKNPIFQDAQQVSPHIKNIVKELSQEKVSFKPGDFPDFNDPRVQTIMNKLSKVKPNDAMYYQLMTIAQSTRNPTIIQLQTCYMFNIYKAGGFGPTPSPDEYGEIYFRTQLEISQIVYGIKEME